MLTLNDGRAELWQWDTGRTLAVDVDCSQVHFSNKVFGRSIDVDVVNGTAVIPDILLQTDNDLNVWAFVGTAENGYTKISKTFKVNRRNKPADYVFTPVEQTTIAEIAAIAKSVRDDADAGLFNGTRGSDGGYYTPAVTQPDANTIRMSFTPSKEDMPAVAETDITLPSGSGSGLTTAQVKALDGMFKVCAFIKADVSEEYNAFRTAFNIEAATITGISATYSGGNVTAGTSVDELTGIVVTANYSDGSKQTVTGYTLSGTIAEGSNTITVTYEGMTTTFTVTGVAVEVTLTSIFATYSGGDVAIGTALTALTGITVTATYSDGSTAVVTGYTLSGTIAEGNNTITVSYGGKTTTITVTGVVEQGGGEETGVSNETTWTDRVAYTYNAVENEYVETNGTITPYAKWNRTPYLYCAGASTLRVIVNISTSLLAANNSYNCFYDENKNFICLFDYSGIDYNTVGAYKDFVVPENATYFIASHKAGVIGKLDSHIKYALGFVPYG